MNISSPHFLNVTITYYVVNNSKFRLSQTLSPEQYLELHIWAGFALTILFTAALSNGLTLAVIIRRKWWKSGIQILIASLTIADLISCAFVRPQQVLNDVLGRRSPWTIPIICRLSGYLSISLSYITPLHQCMIAVNRLFAIIFPQHSLKVTAKKAGIVMAVFSWLVPFTLFTLPLAEVDGFFGTSRPYGQCTWVGSVSSLPFVTVVGVSMIYGPTIIIAVSYGAIFVFLRRHDRTVIPILWPETQLGEWDLANEVKTRGRIARCWKVAKMMVATFLVFIMCYFPLTLFFYLADLSDLYSPPIPTVLAWLILIYWLASFCNPVIYFVMNQDFRNGYMELSTELSKCASGITEKIISRIWKY